MVQLVINEDLNNSGCSLVEGSFYVLRNCRIAKQEIGCIKNRTDIYDSKRVLSMLHIKEREIVQRRVMSEKI